MVLCYNSKSILAWTFVSWEVKRYLISDFSCLAQPFSGRILINAQLPRIRNFIVQIAITPFHLDALRDPQRREEMGNVLYIRTMSSIWDYFWVFKNVPDLKHSNCCCAYKSLICDPITCLILIIHIWNMAPSIGTLLLSASGYSGEGFFQDLFTMFSW